MIANVVQLRGHAAKPIPDLRPEQILDASQTARLLGVSIATLRRMDAAGKLPRAVWLSERRKGWIFRDLAGHLEASKNRKMK